MLFIHNVARLEGSLAVSVPTIISSSAINAIGVYK